MHAGEKISYSLPELITLFIVIFRRSPKHCYTLLFCIFCIFICNKMGSTKYKLLSIALPYLHMHLKIQGIYLCKVLNYDIDKNVFTPVRYSLKKKAILHILNIYFIFHSFLLGRMLSGKNTSTAAKLPAIIHWVLVFLGVSNCILFAKKADIVCGWFNTLLKYMNAQPPAHITDNLVQFWIREMPTVFTSFHKFLMFSPIGAPLLNPVLFAVHSLISPCSPPLIRSALSDCGIVSIIPHFSVDGILKVLFFFLDSIALAIGFTLTPMGCILIILLGAACFLELIKPFKVYRPTDKVSGLVFYRELQILSIYYNDLITGILPVLMISVLALVVIGVYSCIALHRVIPGPLLLFWVTLVFEGSVFVQSATYTFLGLVFDNTKILLGRWKWGLGPKDRYVRRVLASLTPVKIKFGGSGNYMESKTSLRFNKFSVEQAVSLVLMKKKRGNF